MSIALAALALIAIASLAGAYVLARARRTALRVYGNHVQRFVNIETNFAEASRQRDDLMKLVDRQGLRLADLEAQLAAAIGRQEQTAAQMQVQFAATIEHQEAVGGLLAAQLAEQGRDLVALRNRAAAEARAKVLAPHLTEREIRLLEFSELESTPFSATPTAAILVPKPDEAFAPPDPANRGRFETVHLDPFGSEVVIDAGLAPPRLEFFDTETENPTVQAAFEGEFGDRHVLTHFEFDSDPDFRSPNFWRYPALMPHIDCENGTDFTAVRCYALSVIHQNGDGKARELRFPFRVSAMGLPKSPADLTVDKLEQHARTLGAELTGPALVAEIYAYVRQVYLWSADTRYRAPLDVFRTRLGGCGHVNRLFGLLLELNGVRVRGVGGFDPLIRAAWPGSGHSAIEILNSIDSWELIDSYCDIWTKGLSARDLVSDEIQGRQCIVPIDRPLSELVGSELTLARLFRYRTYFDPLDRVPPATMMQLAGNEGSYGRYWPLLPLRAEAEPGLGSNRPREVFVRSRYIVSSSPMTKGHPGIDGPLRASAWSYGSFKTSTTLRSGSRRCENDPQ